MARSIKKPHGKIICPQMRNLSVIVYTGIISIDYLSVVLEINIAQLSFILDNIYLAELRMFIIVEVQKFLLRSYA